MRQLFKFLCFLISVTTFAQVAIFHPVKIHEDDVETQFNWTKL